MTFLWENRIFTFLFYSHALYVFFYLFKYSLGLSDLHGDGRLHPKPGPGRPSGFGFELTFRLVRERGEMTPPTWPANVMQQLAKYVFNSGNTLMPGDHVSWHAPLDGGNGRITQILMGQDPQLPTISTPHGDVRIRRSSLHKDKAIFRFSRIGSSCIRETKSVIWLSLNCIDRICASDIKNKMIFLLLGFICSNCRRYFRGIAGGSTLERSRCRKFIKKCTGLRSMVTHEYEKNAFRHGRRSFYSGEDTVWHRKRWIEHEWCICQMLVSSKIEKIGKWFENLDLIGILKVIYLQVGSNNERQERGEI